VLAVTEKAGTFTSGERRVQQFEKALSAKGECLADYEIAVKLGEMLGLDLIDGSAEEVLKEIIRFKPDYASLTLGDLQYAPEQSPLVSKEALSYTGTVFKNTSGVGVQLSSVAKKTDLSPGKVIQPKAKYGNGTLAVPVTRLYDRGIMIATSEILHPRLIKNQLIVHPADAEKLGLSENNRVEMKLGKNKYEGSIQLDPLVPQGVVLIPRSMGIPLDGPEDVVVKAVK